MPSFAAYTPAIASPYCAIWPATHSCALSGLQSGVSYSARMRRSVASMTRCAPSANSVALLSVGEPLTIRMPPDSSPSSLSASTNAVACSMPDLLVVERDVVREVAAGDEAVVGDDRHVLRVRGGHDADGRLRVDRIEHEHLRAGREGRLGLLLLLRGVLVGVGVEHLVVAELRDPVLEHRAVERLVAGRLRVGQQQRDLAAGSAARRRRPRRRAARERTRRATAAAETARARRSGGKRRSDARMSTPGDLRREGDGFGFDGDMVEGDRDRARGSRPTRRTRRRRSRGARRRRRSAERSSEWRIGAMRISPA